MKKTEPSAQAKKGEQIFVAVLIVFSAAALWQAYLIAGFSKWASPGAFPMLAAATMLASGIAILRNARHQSQAQEPASENATESAPYRPLPIRVVVVALLLILYVLAMPTLGFLLDSWLFLFACITYLWNRSIWFALLISVVSLLAIHVIFRILFQVILPQGTLPGLFL
ncbi:tripartite tricarboxylate transporter TctB family protein [Granulosicoccus antarcticus]|uniref:DUF1468 domain-containing protein n=1 Tax=Granulosicoccus antarcticus IMCC3135 TaxID=1192854 RepID=A0A2Z2NSF1_9GAMM|nr:tripartite tricarboxylate transporter TctB family protein [Granulosicoccus antarcticus]ASJ72668.1 hypothetical protein IMCC3135_12900 [Granulosicoccus antarcticus IMCC3135]